MSAQPDAPEQGQAAHTTGAWADGLGAWASACGWLPVRTMTASGRFDSCNRAWTDLAGRIPGNTRGEDWWDCVRTEDQLRAASEFARGVTSRKEFAISYTIEQMSGCSVRVHERFIPQLDENGLLAWYLCVSRTSAMGEDGARGVAEVARNLAETGLRRLVLGVREPLTAIVGGTEMLTEDDLEPDLRADAGQMVTANVAWLEIRVAELVDLFQLRSGVFAAKEELVPIRAVLSESLDLARHLAELQEITIESDVDASVPDSLRTDGNRLKLIVVGMLRTGVRWLERGDVKLSLRLETDDQPHLDMQLLVQGDAVTGETDRFGADFLDSVGAIIGEQMGAAYELSSENGDFLLRCDLPLGVDVSASAATPRGGEVGDTKPLRGVRVLLAEDGAANQKVLSRHLRAAGAVVHIARHGEAALELAFGAVKRGEAYNVVLMDLHMPGVDGLTATKRLRAEGVQWPVVALTAGGSDADRAECMANGFTDFHLKPIKGPALIAVVEKWSASGAGALEPAA